MIKVVIVGYGYWGPNLVRAFCEQDGARVVAVADQSEERLALARRRHPDLHVTTDAEAVLAMKGIHAVVVATPLSTHYDLAAEALRAGKSVLVAKPLAASVGEAEKLVALAKFGRVLMVDHTFVYTGAVRKIRDLVAADHLGDVRYYDSVRVNLGLFQSDCDVVWDLAAHDFSVLLDVFPDAVPTHVQAVGLPHEAVGGRASAAHLAVWMDGGPLACCHVSWLSPVKVRRTMLAGDRQLVLYDDLEPSEKVRVFDRGVVQTAEDVRLARVGYRLGDVWAPKLDDREALVVEAAHFLDCVRGEAEPITGPASGVAVVRLLEAASRSLALDGAKVPV